MAEHYPTADITAVSNSHGQRAHIEKQCQERNLKNVRVITDDMNRFSIDSQFDRIVSIEMFEHMRNWNSLFRKARSWMHADGRMMIHVFCHRDTPYFFEDRGSGDWMARHFFSGGQMPSMDLAARLTDHLRLEEQWAWNGQHYAQTAEAWLETLDQNRDAAREALTKSCHPINADRQLQRWRMFFMACAELFGLEDGNTWLVGHFKLAPAT